MSVTKFAQSRVKDGVVEVAVPILGAVVWLNEDEVTRLQQALWARQRRLTPQPAPDAGGG